jgi:hypothetical protein
MQKLIIGAALALSLTVVGTASADTFDTFDTGSVNGQFGWKATGPYDQEVVNIEGDKKLRISNAVTSGSFGDMPYSAPVEKAAGENADNNVLTNEFTFASATPGAQQPGLAMSVSPTNGDGARMSYVRLEDRFDGVRVFFTDMSNHNADFTERWIATLDRSVPHTIKFATTFVKGNDNDIVRVSIDGDQKACGTTWENYYRFSEQNNVTPSDRLMWRLSSAPSDPSAVAGKGFLFDDVTSNSTVDTKPKGCALPVGPQGPAGENGVDGKNGATGAVGPAGATGSAGATGPAGADGAAAAAAGVNGAKVKIGATKRTLHVPSSKRMKLVSVRASLRGKSLPVHGQSIKVDLRGKVVGNYNVAIVAKYKTKGGKVQTVRSIRSLSVTIR